MLASEHRLDFTHDYQVGDKQYKRHEVIDMVLDCLKYENKTIPQMKKEINMSEEQLRNLLRYMRNSNLISNTGKKKGDFFLFEIYRDCLLAELLYPSPKKIEKQFKIKERKTRKVDDGTSKSSGTKMNNFVYSNHHLNSVYYSDGD